jgi:hypothetical protein
MESSQPPCLYIPVCLSAMPTAILSSCVSFLSARFPLLLTGMPAGGLRENHTHSKLEVQTKKRKIFHPEFRHYSMKE